MLTHMKLVFYRIVHNKAFLITYLLLIPIVMGLAIYFTNSLSYHMQIGIVGDIHVVTNESVDYITLDKMPLNSQMVFNQYDAVIYQEGEKINVFSTKGEEYNQLVQLLVTGQIDTLPSEGERGTATQILGFLMMLISLLGVQIYQYYFDERKGMNKRVLGTSVRYYQYMLSHFLVGLSFLFIPALIVICSAILIFDITLSIALWQFVLVLLLLCFFATSFGLWINSLSKTIEESLMFGNMFAIVGTIISGGIVEVTDNQIFYTIVQIFPQKHVMSLLSALENQTILPSLGILYVVVISIVLIFAAIVIEKKKLASR